MLDACICLYMHLVHDYVCVFAESVNVCVSLRWPTRISRIEIAYVTSAFTLIRLLNLNFDCDFGFDFDLTWIWLVGLLICPSESIGSVLHTTAFQMLLIPSIAVQSLAWQQSLVADAALCRRRCSKHCYTSVEVLSPRLTITLELRCWAQGWQSLWDAHSSGKTPRLLKHQLLKIYCCVYES